MLGDVADYSDHTLALDYFTLVTNLFHRCTYFHLFLLQTLLMQVNISGPFSVIATVCSK